MSKSAIAATIGIILAIVAVVVVVKIRKTNNSTPTVTEEPTLDLPINVLPLEERPVITLSPDATGRSLNLSVDAAPKDGEMEYELVYNSAEKQEGVFGRLELTSEPQPIIKSLLLGSKSGGGKVTYHEGVTGGSLTVTYGTTRLKESWNFLAFDPTDPIISSVDGRFHVTLDKTALKKDTKITTMKTFGYAKAGLPETVKIIAGPYSYATGVAIKGNASVELKLPAGEHVNPTLYEWDGKAWKKLTAKLGQDSVTATAKGSSFLVTAE
jgi:hypothetical protein